MLKRVLIMAGGTGGHVFPGLAVATYLRSQGIDVHWLGTASGLESRVVLEAGLPLHHIKISGLRGKGKKALLMAPIKIGQAVMQSIRIMREVNPDLVIGMGGFVSGPGGIASWLLRRPLIIHEQNAKAGLTNKMLGKIAKKILAGFPHAFPPAPQVMTIGNPVREDIALLPPPEQRFREARTPFHLLVLGGSLGAQALNDVLPQALAQMDRDLRPVVRHQTGEKDAAATQQAYAALGVEAEVVPFIKDMASAYAWADMVVCRAGALTIAELCAVGLGAILVPYPHAVDDHQTANARFMVEHQAALLIQQADLTADQLAAILTQFSASPMERLRMAQAAYPLRHTQVVETIFTICKEICH